jgi:energy-coupling factor transporter ATP-binding protein EcfA2
VIGNVQSLGMVKWQLLLMIHIQGLTYRFRGSVKDALHKVNLHIEPGEFLVITGPSGCGKSTLALAIGGYLFRQYDGDVTGSVKVAGMDVRHCPIYDVAEVVGLVQQNPEAQFCTLTVQDEVAFGLENRCLSRDKIRERMDWALNIVGAENLMDRELAALSGGEKQKVAIAAMMASKPQVLIFDEPTSNLDPSATADIFRVIERIRATDDITVIVIEHKIDYLQDFHPRFVTMQDGGIVADSSSADRAISPVPPHKDAVSNVRDRSTPPIILSDAESPVVHVQNLSASYHDHTVLHSCTLDVYPGEFISVMGDNASGKTTFLHCLLGLHPPSHGRIEVLGHDVCHTAVSEIARHVGLVFQNPDHQLFADSVWDEATFAPRNFATLDRAMERNIRELLDRCGLDERCDDHPYRLSYGEKRRLNLISVLGYTPHLLLLDEILIGQDPLNAAFLLDLLRDFVAGGGSVIMVNHVPRITRKYSNRILFFDQGQIVVDAPTDEAFKELITLGWNAYVA